MYITCFYKYQTGQAPAGELPLWADSLHPKAQRIRGSVAGVEKRERLLHPAHVPARQLLLAARFCKEAHVAPQLHVVDGRAVGREGAVVPKPDRRDSSRERRAHEVLQLGCLTV